MMKNLTAAVAVLACTIGITETSFAQKSITKDTEIGVYAGLATKIRSNQEYAGLAHYSNERIAVKLTGGRNDEFNVYDTLLNITETYTAEDAKYGHMSDNNLIGINGKHYLLKDSVDEASSTAFLYLAEFNVNDGKAGEFTELTTLEGDAYFKYFASHYVAYRISDKGDRVIIYMKIEDGRNDDNERVDRLRFISMSASMTKEWERDVAMSDDAGQMSAGGKNWYDTSEDGPIQVAGNGSVYAWGWTDRGASQTPAERYKLKMYKISGKEVDHTGIFNMEQGKWLVTATEQHLVFLAAYDQNGKVTQDVEFPANAEGIKVIRWNGESEQKPTERQIEITMDHLSKNRDPKETKKLEKLQSKGTNDLVKVVLDHAVVLDDNSILLTGQTRYVETKVATNGYTTITHYGEHIHLFNISQTDKLAWSNQIPLNQENKNGDGFGYVFKVSNNKAYFIFNDHEDNVAKEWDTSMKLGKYSEYGNPIARVIIDLNDPEADQVRKQLFKSGSAGGMFRPQLATMPGHLNTGLVYIAGDKEKQRLLRFTFN